MREHGCRRPERHRQQASETPNLHHCLLLQRTFALACVLGMCSFRSGRHETSAICWSSTRFQRLVICQSPSQLLGSVIVYSISSVAPALIMRMRSMIRSSSLGNALVDPVVVADEVPRVDNE